MTADDDVPNANGYTIDLVGSETEDEDEEQHLQTGGTGSEVRKSRSSGRVSAGAEKGKEPSRQKQQEVIEISDDDDD